MGAMRQAIDRLQGSLIREIANAGMGRADVLAFWFGESDEVTPEPIRRAAIESLERGETFYSQNLGLPELRDALAAYATSLHGPGPIGSDRIVDQRVHAFVGGHAQRDLEVERQLAVHGLVRAHAHVHVALAHARDLRAPLAAGAVEQPQLVAGLKAAYLHVAGGVLRQSEFELGGQGRFDVQAQGHGRAGPGGWPPVCTRRGRA